MEKADDPGRLVKMLRRLLEELQRHADDYHHVTPGALLEEARSLLGELERGRHTEAAPAEGRGGTRRTP